MAKAENTRTRQRIPHPARKARYQMSRWLMITERPPERGIFIGVGRRCGSLRFRVVRSVHLAVLACRSLSAGGASPGGSVSRKVGLASARTTDDWAKSQQRPLVRSSHCLSPAPKERPETTKDACSAQAEIIQ